VHPDDLERVTRTYAAVVQGLERASSEHRKQRRDGRWIWVEARVRLVKSTIDGTSVIVGALRDVSGRKEMELEAVAARGRAEAAAAAQGQFLTTMSHELRTPLTSVLGFADILLDRKDLVPEVRRQVTLIQTSGAFLLTVVNDILDFSRIEEGKLQL